MKPIISVNASTASSGQTYPADRFEVLVVDDDSTDNTAQIVASAGMSNLRLLFVDDRFLDMAAKKRPLSVGIQRAEGNGSSPQTRIARLPPTWVGHMASYMTADAGVVIGFSQLGETRSLFHRLQALDFFLLMAAAAGAAGVGMPLAASGQNFAYRKSLFERVGRVPRRCTPPVWRRRAAASVVAQSMGWAHRFCRGSRRLRNDPSARNPCVAVATTQAVGVQCRVSTASQSSFFCVHCRGLYGERAHSHWIAPLDDIGRLQTSSDLLVRQTPI